MAVIRKSELKKMNKEEAEKKLQELRLELVKARVSASKNASSKTKEIKRAIARILTLKK